MSPETKTSEYLLLIRGNNWEESLSPDEIQASMERFMRWMDGLTAAGKLKGAQPLQEVGKTVSGKSGRTVADGPFAESKEAIGGYFLLQLDTFEEAVQAAQACPLLDYGATMEVRPIAAFCPSLQKARERQLAEATA
jgi:hypothetical protein